MGVDWRGRWVRWKTKVELCYLVIAIVKKLLYMYIQ